MPTGPSSPAVDPGSQPLSNYTTRGGVLLDLIQARLDAQQGVEIAWSEPTGPLPPPLHARAGACCRGVGGAWVVVW
jgi:hypothetical protein